MSSFLETSIEMVQKFPIFKNQILYAPKTSLEPNIYIYIPDWSSTCHCPQCGDPLRMLESYTGQRKDYPGRTLFDLERNARLLTVILTCKSCRSNSQKYEHLGTDFAIVEQAKTTPDFLLTHKNAYTSRLLVLVNNQIPKGKINTYDPSKSLFLGWTSLIFVNFCAKVV